MMRALVSRGVSIVRALSTAAPPNEQIIRDKLTAGLTVKGLSVEDISGGCGAMFQVQ